MSKLTMVCYGCGLTIDIARRKEHDKVCKGAGTLPVPEDQKSVGVKLDDAKPPVDSLLFQYFPRALMAIAMVSEYGMRKYAESNADGSGWERVPDGFRRYSDAQARHQLKRHIEGEYDDGDSGLPHLAQRCWNDLATLEKAIQDGRIDIRRGNDIEHVDGKPVPVPNTARAIKP